MKTHKLMIIMGLGLVFSLALSACATEVTPTPAAVETISRDYVIAEGRLLPNQSSWLNFSVQGRVAEILVQEGVNVTGGQALIRLEDSEAAQAGLAAAELALTLAQQDYDKFTRTADLGAAGAWQVYLDAQKLRGEAEQEWEDLDLDYLEDRVDDALIEVRDKESDLEDAQDEWDKYLDVDETNYARQSVEDDLENAQESFNEAQRGLEEARREIDNPRANLDAALAAEAEAKRAYEMWQEDGFDLDQIALLESRLSSAKVNLTAAQNTLDSYTLSAPFSGTVTDISLDLGQFVGPESRALQLADLSQFMIETSDLTELEVVKIFAGQQVEIRPDALPEATLTGIVENISQSFTTQAGDIIYTVTISLDESHPDLRWGMTVELTFLPE
jgi:multidrug efflux pump subunit AcrA (membrane-fusion protein)